MYWGSTSDTCRISCFPRSVWRKPRLAWAAHKRPGTQTYFFRRELFCVLPWNRFDQTFCDKLVSSPSLAWTLLKNGTSNPAQLCISSRGDSRQLRRCGWTKRWRRAKWWRDGSDHSRYSKVSTRPIQRSIQITAIDLKWTECKAFVAEEDTFLLRSYFAALCKHKNPWTDGWILVLPAFVGHSSCIWIRRDVHPSWHSRWCLSIAISERRGTCSVMQNQTLAFKMTRRIVSSRGSTLRQWRSKSVQLTWNRDVGEPSYLVFT